MWYIWTKNLNFEKQLNTHFKRSRKDWSISNGYFCVDTYFNSNGKVCKNLFIAAFLGVSLPTTRLLRFWVLWDWGPLYLVHHLITPVSTVPNWMNTFRNRSSLWEMLPTLHSFIQHICFWVSAVHHALLKAMGIQQWAKQVTGLYACGAYILVEKGQE